VAGWATNLSVGAPTDAGQVLDFLVSTDKPALFTDPPTISPVDGTLSYTPAPGAAGTATVTVQLHDSGGTEGGGVDTSAAQMFTIHLSTDVAGGDVIVPGADVGSWDGLAYTGVTGLVASGDYFSSMTSGTFTMLGVGPAATAGDVHVMYTYGGDANLDGKINVDDYGRIDFNASLAGACGWANGDFNYDGKINVDDYGIIDFNVGIQGPPLGHAVATAAAGALTLPLFGSGRASSGQALQRDTTPSLIDGLFSDQGIT
jgi:hypothetical protein